MKFHISQAKELYLRACEGHAGPREHVADVLGGVAHRPALEQPWRKVTNVLREFTYTAVYTWIEYFYDC